MANNEWNLIDRFGVGDQVGGDPGRFALAGSLERLFQFALPLEQRLYLFARSPMGAPARTANWRRLSSLDAPRRRREAPPQPRSAARQRRWRLADNAEQADFARGAGVRAAAEFHRVAVQLRRLPPICTTRTMSPYLSPKNCMMSLRAFDFRIGQLRSRTRRAFSTIRSFTSRSMSRTCAGVSGGAVEIESELVGTDKRPLLRGVAAGHFVQRPVQQMGHGVVALDCGATSTVDGNRDLAPTGGASLLRR